MGSLNKLFFTCENMSCISRVNSDVLCVPLANFRFSNAYSFLISGQNHKVCVFIFLIRSQEKFGH